MSDTRLRKEERLKSRKQLESLFADGQSLRVFPLRFIWTVIALADRQYPVRVAFSASKRHWKRAVDRNLLKRRMREAYRFEKNTLYASMPPERQILLVCIYTSDTILPFEEIKTAVRKGLQRLIAQVPV